MKIESLVNQAGVTIVKVGSRSSYDMMQKIKRIVCHMNDDGKAFVYHCHGEERLVMSINADHVMVINYGDEE